MADDRVARLTLFSNGQPRTGRAFSNLQEGRMKHLNLELEKLEERIATWAVPTCGGGGSGSKGSGGCKDNGSGSKGSKSHGSGSKGSGSKGTGSKS
jgi:hypothetical protein